MNTTLLLKDHQKAIQEIPSEEILKPHIPMAVFIQEALELNDVCINDMDTLKQFGLKEEYLSQLPERIELRRLSELSYAQAQREKAKRNKLQKEFITEVKSIYGHCRKAYVYFRKDRKDNKSIPKAYTRNDQMIQGIYEISRLFKAPEIETPPIISEEQLDAYILFSEEASGRP